MTSSKANPSGLQAGFAALSKGSYSEARAAFTSVLKSDPANLDALSFLGFAEASLGEVQAGLEKTLRAVDLNPENPQYRSNLAFVLTKQGEPAKAIAELERGLKLKPGDPALLENLGRLYQDQGRFEDSIPLYRALLKANLKNPTAFNRLIGALIKTGQANEAYAFVEQAAPELPDNAFLWMVRGQTAQATERWEEAGENFKKLIGYNPADISFKRALADCLLKLDRMEDLVPVVKDLLTADANPDHLLLSAQVFQKLTQYDKARYQLEEALRQKPDFSEAMVNLGTLLVFEAELEPARALFEKALAIDPANVEAIMQLNRISPLPDTDATLRRLESLKASPGQKDLTHIGLTLGQLYEEAGEFDKAFDNYRLANERTARFYGTGGSVYDPGAIATRFQRVRDIFSRDAVASLRFQGSDVETPIFIIGMPRSGTTLLEQIISSHSRVFGAGELEGGNQLMRALVSLLDPAGGKPLQKVLEEFGAAWGRSYLNALPARAPGEDRVTDKMPNNFFNFGILRLLFPQAAFIHIRRNPLDTCVSMYFRRFNRNFPYATDLKALGEFYRRYFRLMAHWREVFPRSFIDIAYEDLVEAPEAQAKKIMAHCRLDWQPHCLEFHKRKSKVTTMSSFQVRKPIYKGSVGRWKNFRRHLGPVVEGLGDEVLKEWRDRGLVDL